MEAAAQDAFRVWVGEPDLQWARDAWQRLCSHGYADYQDEAERIRILIRFLALAGFYYDFCAVAFDESNSPLYATWQSFLGVEKALEAVQVDQEESVELEEELPESKLLRRIESERKDLVSLLTECYGNESLLFASLWRSSKPVDEETESDDEILNDWSSSKQAAFGWLVEGAEEILDPY